MGDEGSVEATTLFVPINPPLEIGNSCRIWILTSGSLAIIVNDVGSYVAPGPNLRRDHYVLLLLGLMMEAGFFDKHADSFIQADTLHALAKYFQKNGPPYDLYTVAGLLRRPLRLAGEGTPVQISLLKESQVLEVMVNRIPEHLGPLRDGESPLMRQVQLLQGLLKRFLASGTLPPGQIPPKVDPPPRIRLPPG